MPSIGSSASFGRSKVGHAGTLDPLANGVLLVMLGGATRLTEYLQRLPKQYRATFLLGRQSDTEDTQGEVILLPRRSRRRWNSCSRHCPNSVDRSCSDPRLFQLSKSQAVGPTNWRRAGQPVRLTPRKVQIDELQIEHYAYPQLVLEIRLRHRHIHPIARTRPGRGPGQRGRDVRSDADGDRALGCGTGGAS